MKAYFDALVEGQLHATVKGNTVILYRLYPDASDQIAIFNSEEAFTGLIGGYQDTATFNEAMDARRKQFAKVVA